VIVVHRLTGSTALAMIAALVELLIWPRTYSYPKVLLYAAAACAMVAVAASPSRRRVVLAGAVAAIAFLFRHDHGVYIGMAAAATVMLATIPLGWRAMAERVAWLGVPVVILVSPWLGLVAYHQGLGAYIRSGLEFSRAESERNGAGLSLPAFRLSLAELVSLGPPQRPTARLQWKPDTAAAARRAIEAR
jgi:hypothetical protein